VGKKGFPLGRQITRETPGKGRLYECAMEKKKIRKKKSHKEE